MLRRIRSLIDRLETDPKGRVLVQLVKFSIVGASNTAITLIVSYALLVLFRRVLHMDSIWCVHVSTGVGYFAGVVNSFYWSTRYVFTNRQEKSRKKVFLKVVICYIGAYLLSLLVTHLLLTHTAIDPTWAPILQVAVVTPVNFTATKLWAFKDR